VLLQVIQERLVVRRRAVVRQVDRRIDQHLAADGAPAIAEREVLADELAVDEGGIEKRIEVLVVLGERVGQAQCRVGGHHLVEAIASQAHEAGAHAFDRDQPLGVHADRRAELDREIDLGAALALVHAGDEGHVVRRQPQQVLGRPRQVGVDEDQIAAIAGQEARHQLVARIGDQAVADLEVDLRRAPAALLQRRHRAHQRRRVVGIDVAVQAGRGDEQGRRGRHGGLAATGA
jgi:hypothetical protein